MGKYEVIIKAAEYGNITKAAKELGYTQSGISHMIKNLEQELQVKIFRRERQGITPTKAGQQLLQIMYQIEALENSMYETSFSYDRNILNVGSLYSVSANWIPGILKMFYKLYPNTRIHLIEKPDYPAIEAAIKDGSLDCGFFAGSHYSSVDFIPLYEDPYYAVVPVGNPLASQEMVTLEDISRYPFIMPSEGVSNTVIRDLVKDLHMAPNLFSESLDDLATLTLVEQNLGVTILPGLIAKTTFRQIATAPLEEKYVRTIGLMIKDQDGATDVCKAFLQCTKEWLALSGNSVIHQDRHNTPDIRVYSTK